VQGQGELGQGRLGGGALFGLAEPVEFDAAVDGAIVAVGEAVDVGHFDAVGGHRHFGRGRIDRGGLDAELPQLAAVFLGNQVAAIDVGALAHAGGGLLHLDQPLIDDGVLFGVRLDDGAGELGQALKAAFGILGLAVIADVDLFGLDLFAQGSQLLIDSLADFGGHGRILGLEGVLEQGFDFGKFHDFAPLN